MQPYHYNNTPGPISGEETKTANYSMPSQPLPNQRRRRLSQGTLGGPHKVLATSRSLGLIPGPRRHGSNTWTSSSGDPLLLYEGDRVDDREQFIHSYNHLANKYGIRSLVPGDFPTKDNTKPEETRKASWVSKAIRRTSSGHSAKAVTVRPEERHLRRRRSISDAALHLIHPKKEGFKNQDLQTLARLCGKSLFYLPQSYAPCSLVLPTCFRAVAQPLVQHVGTRGIFRIPGSTRVVNTLYEYYCTDKDTDNISSTTRCPDLPTHIKCGPHDIASVFKKFLSGLPGGILGSLSLFDALVAIHCQLQVGPEYGRTRQTKLRARLIALAIGTVKSQYQRELICAVFGLLCLIGRAAETAPREDEHGRPLPTIDLMGYNALGTVFGPLLINELLDSYKMGVADPIAGLVLLPVSPPKSRKERCRQRLEHKRSNTQPDDSTMDKVRIANDIAEMVIIHWREVVRQMRTLGAVKGSTFQNSTDQTNGVSVSSASDTYSLSRPPLPPSWNESGLSHQYIYEGVPPEALTPTPSSRPRVSRKSEVGNEDQIEPLSINRRRSRPSSSGVSHRVPARASVTYLSPTVEESPAAGNGKASGTQVPRPTTGRTQRFSIESASNSPSFERSLVDGESGDKGKTSQTNGFIPSRGNLSNASLGNNGSKLGNKSSSDHIISGSEITSHSVSSSNTDVRNYDEYLAQPGNYPVKGRVSTWLGKRSSKTPITSTISLPIIEASPVDEWDALARASQESIESLAQSIKERRLRRSPHGTTRRSEGNPQIPEWKREIIKARKEERRKQQPAGLPPKKKDGSEISPLCRRKAMRYPMKSNTGSPAKNGSIPQRSSSKPADGAVKAMAAIFKKSSDDTPTRPTDSRTERLDRSSVDTDSFRTPHSGNGSVPKPGMPGAFPSAGSQLKIFDSFTGGFKPDVAAHGNGFAVSNDYRNASPASSSRATPRYTPSQAPPVSLRPIGVPQRKALSPSAKQTVPQHSRELSQPPSLGTMVPHPEEPPIAQHVSFTRPTQGDRSTEHDHPEQEQEQWGSLTRGNERRSISNSTLHAQIRSLQRRLDALAEERAQLRAQLEAVRGDEDIIGRLCEQLRSARRECSTWRSRAEAAEKRVAVLERFTTRVRGLRDAVIRETGLQVPAMDGHVDRVRGQDRSSLNMALPEHGAESWAELQDNIVHILKERVATRGQSASSSSRVLGEGEVNGKADMGKGKITATGTGL